MGEGPARSGGGGGAAASRGPCAGSSSRPAGQPGEQGPRRRGRRAGARARRKPGSRVTHEGREPAAGLTEAAGETVHLAEGERTGLGAQRGGRFIQHTDRVWRPRSRTRWSSASPDAAPDSRLRPSTKRRSVGQGERRTARRSPGLCLCSLPRSPKPQQRAPRRAAPRPRARRHASDPAPHVMDRGGALSGTPLPLPGLCSRGGYWSREALTWLHLLAFWPGVRVPCPPT